MKTQQTQKRQKTLRRAPRRSNRKVTKSPLVSFLPSLANRQGSTLPKFGFPAMLETRLRYVENVTIYSASGALGSYIFSCNGLYDPNITTTGHQPMYFDQLCAIYDHYTVTSSKIKIIIGPQATVLQAGGFFVLTVDDDASAFTNLREMQEQSSATNKYIPEAFNSTTELSKTWTAASYFTKDKMATLADTDLQGTAAANPAEQSYYMLGFQSVSGAASTSVTCIVEIEFVATFAELKTMTAS